MSPMRVIRPVSRRFWDDWHLPLAMLTAGLLLVGVFAFRAWQTSRTDTKLCHAIVKIVSDGDKALAGISYYKAHPKELADAHARNVAVIRQLNCSKLPSG
jgi:hypothetical protein